MDSSRRQFVVAIGGVAVGAKSLAQAPLKVIRPSTDMDLSASALMDAIGKIGPPPYVLTVHLEEFGRAVSVLCRAFPGWETNFRVTTHDFQHYDAWSLENSRFKFYSDGA